MTATERRSALLEPSVVARPSKDDLFVACYLPLTAWPVLVGAVTHAYYRRRTTTEGH